MAIAKTIFFKRAFISLIGGMLAFFSTFPASASVTAETPVVLTDSTILSVSFDECKRRAATAASYLLKEVQTSEERNLRFKVTGTNKDTVAVIYCIERSQGTIAIITTSTYNKQNKNEGSYVYDRLTSFVTKGK